MGAVDAESLYWVLRLRRPDRVMQVGTGTSPVFIARASADNALDGLQDAIVAIEPYRHQQLAGLLGEVLLDVIAAPVQRVDLAVFEGSQVFWNTWALVLAYLSHDSSHEVLSCSRYLHNQAPEILAEGLHAYRSDLAVPPSSLVATDR